MTQSKLLSLLVAAGFCLPVNSFAQNLINVKIAGGAPGTPSGAAVIGTAGDVWNYFPSLNGRANGGGVVTNATTIKDSSGATLSGVTITDSISGGYDHRSHRRDLKPLLPGAAVHQSFV